ncbi:hypothetical protein [Winogradskyella aquimaris]|uniref:Uncharacterized protein n=1 Tax=Winogradskyella aquimaris TaxID=864074 RepID=A0ABU5EP34_9FLAO|nr:hypothetical protein [Winogradskyella aquimaris]MDY2588216.1 hypothetical protein [Winogradskyella aquimaris]
MSKYKIDRSFSDYVHQNLAVPLIYKPIDWKEIQLKQDYAKYIDMVDGIDYIFKNGNQIMTVQERFREKKYQNYTDFTIRYRRDLNQIKDRHKSEYYKMKAHYFTYGIIDSSKSDFKSAKDFIKYAIIDLKRVYEKLDEKNIFILDDGKKVCEIVDGNRIKCPVKYNSDGSSSFFPIDIAFLVKLWGERMVIAEKGFL